MRYLSILFIFLFLDFSSCLTGDNDNMNGCTDSNALNYDSGATSDNNSCNYSKVAFFAQYGSYLSVPIIKIDITVDGQLIGSINNGAFWPSGPGNCSAAGTVPYQFNSSQSIDWNASIILANGAVLLSSGVQSPSRFSECIRINVTN